MRYALFLLNCVFLISSTVAAQDTAATKQPEYGWKHSLVSNVLLTQVSFTDWAQGGENAFAYTVSAEGKSTDDQDKVDWTTTYKMAFGQARLGSQGVRKIDDIIDLSSVVAYKLGIVVNPYVSATLKTQFAKGFVYDASGDGTAISQFFDPAYLTQTAGAEWKPLKEVRTRLGAGLREVLTKTFNQYTDDPTTSEVEKTTLDGGLESVTNIEWPWDDNLLFSTQLELFSPFTKMDQIIVRNTSSVTAKVNKYLTANINLQLINERRVSPRTQIKETISMGLSYTIF